ncbi:Uncharacterized protein PBTT_10406 [Plasmodiophora brassicae]|uniref:Uncharacterized protein n=1 Tax=Plasmodiophora brassicae TaxID=37360 RepID=A0A0G4IJ38_PLABS|nr:hypothetical protein PBRA_009629 [Plasmodiophora brassicae]
MGVHVGRPAAIQPIASVSQRHLAYYRMFGSAFLLSTIVLGVSTADRLPYFVFLTNWVAVLNFAYFTVAAVATYRDSARGARAAHIMSQVCLPNAIMVTLIYWLFVHPFIPAGRLSQIMLVRNVIDHGVTLLFLVADFLLCETLFVIKEFYFPTIVALYIPFSAAWTFLTGKKVYPMLTFRSVRSYGFLVASVLTSLVAFAAVVWIGPYVKRAVCNDDVPCSKNDEVDVEMGEDGATPSSDSNSDVEGGQ